MASPISRCVRGRTRLALVAKEHGQIVEEDKEERDPEREALRRLALAQIRQYPDPALRLRAGEVGDFDAELRHLAERMTQLMRDANGVGLAATQVGVLRRLFVCRLGEEEDEKVGVFANPAVAAAGEERETDDEGCLSLQGVLVPVERTAALTLEAQDLSGKPVRVELKGLEARVVQHELDHLDGVLILDRTTDDARREALARLRPRPLLVGRA
jgi:peptide deformylase